MEVSALPDGHPATQAVIELLETPARMSGFRAFDPAEDVLWIAYEGPTIWGAVSTRGLDTGVAELIHVAGRRGMEWVKPIEAIICDWAVTNGAPRIVAQGRKGWGRLFAPLGWRVVKAMDGVTYYEKDL